MQATRHLGLVAVLLLGGVLAGGSAALAQPGDSGKPAATEPANPNEKTVERLIYMPFKSLKAVFEKPDGSIFVPYAEYIRLLESARANALGLFPDPDFESIVRAYVRENADAIRLQTH